MIGTKEKQSRKINKKNFFLSIMNHNSDDNASGSESDVNDESYTDEESSGNDSDDPARRRKTSIECVKTRKTGKVAPRRRKDGFYSWLGFVNRWREKDLAQRQEDGLEDEKHGGPIKIMPLKKAFDQIRNDGAWEKYKERNKLEKQKPPQKLFGAMLPWVKFGEIWNYIHPKLEWKDILQDIKQPYKEYLEDAVKYQFPGSDRVTSTTNNNVTVRTPSDFIAAVNEVCPLHVFSSVVIVDQARHPLFGENKDGDQFIYGTNPSSTIIYDALGIKGDPHSMKLAVTECEASFDPSSADTELRNFNGRNRVKEIPVHLIHAHFPNMPASQNEDSFADNYCNLVFKTVENVLRYIKNLRLENSAVYFPFPLAGVEMEILRNNKRLFKFFAADYFTCMLLMQEQLYKDDDKEDDKGDDEDDAEDDVKTKNTVVVAVPLDLRDEFYDRIVLFQKYVQKLKKQKKKNAVEARKAARQAERNARDASRQQEEEDEGGRVEELDEDEGDQVEELDEHSDDDAAGDNSVEDLD